MDVAPFVAALENASGRQALVFGKPALAFFHAAAERLRHFERRGPHGGR